VAGAAVGKVSILVFLDYFATNLFLERKALPKELYFAPQRVPKRGRYRKPEPVFWIKPFSKRFDVSILVLLDSFATPQNFIPFPFSGMFSPYLYLSIWFMEKNI